MTADFDYKTDEFSQILFGLTEDISVERFNLLSSSVLWVWNNIQMLLNVVHA